VGADGGLWIWGFGETCQLGRPTEDDELVPKRVPPTHKLAGQRVILMLPDARILVVSCACHQVRPLQKATSLLTS
jgi:alpha-tubulin suppressor-like RCC1 family protein